MHKEKQHQASHLTPHEINDPTERSLLTQESRQANLRRRRPLWLSTIWLNAPAMPLRDQPLSEGPPSLWIPLPPGPTPVFSPRAQKEPKEKNTSTQPQPCERHRDTRWRRDICSGKETHMKTLQSLPWATLSTTFLDSYLILTLCEHRK